MAIEVIVFHLVNSFKKEVIPVLLVLMSMVAVAHKPIYGGFAKNKNVNRPKSLINQCMFVSIFLRMVLVLVFFSDYVYLSFS